jgi:hypothetical protein
LVNLANLEKVCGCCKTQAFYCCSVMLGIDFKVLGVDLMLVNMKCDALQVQYGPLENMYCKVDTVTQSGGVFSIVEPEKYHITLDKLLCGSLNVALFSNQRIVMGVGCFPELALSDVYVPKNVIHSHAMSYIGGKQLLIKISNKQLDKPDIDIGSISVEVNLYRMLSVKLVPGLCKFCVGAKSTVLRYH